MLTLDGSSLKLGVKPSLVGGADKLPKDFEKARHYVDDEQVKSIAMRLCWSQVSC